MPVFQSFSGVLHHFSLVKLATLSIRVNRSLGIKIKLVSKGEGVSLIVNRSVSYKN